MTGVVCMAVVAVPVAVGLIRSRQWLARQVGGRFGVWWCVVAALGVGLLPGFVVGALAPTGWSAGRQHIAYACLTVPLVAAGALLRRRGAGSSGTAAEPRSAGPEPKSPSTADAPVTGEAPAVAPAAPGPKPAVPKPAPATPGPKPAAPKPATAASPKAAEPPQAPAAAPDGRQVAPTTVTECVLSMSISCEEYILQNFVMMAQAPLPETQRDTIRRLVEETDDKLARLRAARQRHQGEEVVRVSWAQLPDVDLPVVKPGASVDQVREKAIRQTQVMIDFYRTVAAYVQRPSLKSLLVNLALDGQRHLAVIEQTST